LLYLKNRLVLLPEMKIFWLAPYPVHDLRPELKGLTKGGTNTSGWIVNLAKSLAQLPNIELHIITSCAHLPYDQEVKKHGINFHVIRYTLPLIKSGFPGFFPFDSIREEKAPFPAPISNKLVLTSKYFLTA